jgi:hypothetical protein
MRRDRRDPRSQKGTASPLGHGLFATETFQLVVVRSAPEHRHQDERVNLADSEIPFWRFAFSRASSSGYEMISETNTGEILAESCR